LGKVSNTVAVEGEVEIAGAVKKTVVVSQEKAREVVQERRTGRFRIRHHFFLFLRGCRLERNGSDIAGNSGTRSTTTQNALKEVANRSTTRRNRSSVGSVLDAVRRAKEKVSSFSSERKDFEGLTIWSSLQQSR